MQTFNYYIFYFFVKTFSLLPFRLVYLISDFMYVIVRYVVRYRRDVVKANLSSSFPEKSEDELIRIEKDFYHLFCDVLLESIKSYRMSYDEITRRVEFEGIEMMESLFKNGKNVIVAAAHSGNWEWMAAVYWQIKIENLVGCEFNRPSKNPRIDEVLLGIRRRLGMITINKNEPIRPLLKLKRDNKIFGVGLLADQTPSAKNINFWTPFLNRETAFLTGPERIAKMFHAAMAFCDVERLGRGRYKYKLVKIADDVADLPENEATRIYAQLLEESIKRDPASWLWSHRRWKHTKESVAAALAKQTV